MTKMTNAFWREVMDHLPGIFLLFRVDEKEEAHLIFANGNIRHSLGYTPEEFVLASESAETAVASGIAELIESIAVLSHNGNRSQGNSRSYETGVGKGDSDGRAPICRFYSKRAAECTFAFEFRIFSVPSAAHPFIAVALRPRQEGVTAPELPATRFGGAPPFVTESPLMKALMNKVDAVASRGEHLLFRGEAGTGKRTIARQVLKGDALLGNTSLEWNLPDLTSARQDEAVKRLCDKDGTDSPAVSTSGKLTLLIVEIGGLSPSNQNRLLIWMRERAQAGIQTRILATSDILLEEQMQKGKFSAELYYYLGFDTLLLPPLSQRKEDLLYLTEVWLPGAAEFLGLGRVSIKQTEMEALLRHNWPGNFHEFFREMRKSLLMSDPGDFRLSLDSGGAASPVANPGNGSGGDVPELQEIVRFDEMNRRYLARVLQKTKGVIYGKEGAAQLLGMKPTTLQSKLKKLGVR